MKNDKTAPLSDSKGAAIDEILTDFGSKVYSLATEHKGFDNKYPEVGEAKQRINERVLEWMGTLEIEDKWRDQLKQEYLKEFGQ